MNSQDTEPTVEPRQLLDRALRFAGRALRFRWVALGVLLLGVGVCAAFLLLRTPRYRSQTVLLYDEGIRMSETGQPAASQKSLAVRMQEILTSRTQLQGVIEQHGLYPEIRKSYGMSDAIDEMKKHLEFRAPGGDTFTIAFEGVSAEQARAVTARLAELLIEQDSELRKKQAAAARDFLSSEKERAQKQLKDAEQSLAEFMAEHPRFALDAMPLATGAAIRASVSEPTGSAQAGGAIRRVIRVPVAGAAPVVEPAPRAARPPTPAELEAKQAADAEVGRAQAALAAARENLNDKKSRYTDAHPDVVAARQAVERAQARQDAALLKVPKLNAAEPNRGSRVSDNPYGPSEPMARYITVPKPAGPAASAGAPKTEDLVVLETDWARLTRSVTEARQRHDQVEAALFKADIASSSASQDQGAQVTVIDPAFVPQRPVPPGPRTIAALFVALSLAVAVLVALGCAAFDDRLHDSESVGELTPVLAQVPRARRTRRAHA